jgi:hypothetical protein
MLSSLTENKPCAYAGSTEMTIDELTFARVAIENGRPIFWLSKHLGHSSLDVTANVYGHFERATRQKKARAMAGVFGV